MTDPKPKRKNQYVPRWKWVSHYVFPLLLVGFTWLILGNFPYSSTSDEQVILPLLLYPEILWFVGSLISLLCFVMIYRVRLKLLVYFNLVAFGTILVILVLLMLFVPNERIRLRQSVYHQEQSFHLVDYWRYPTYIRDDLNEGSIILFHCDSYGIFCDVLDGVQWGPFTSLSTIFGVSDLPDSDLQLTDDDRLIFYVGDILIFEYQLEPQAVTQTACKMHVSSRTRWQPCHWETQ